ncbi:MAG: hypothetical protein AAGI66_08260 [Cyanobacteria bacterium P01_H01_bin.74]
MQDLKRWYDNRETIRTFTELLGSMPDQLQTLFAEALLWYMVRERKVNTKGKPYVSIGAAKIMGLHQSKKKRRKYDQNLKLHEAVNAFYMLPDSDQNTITNAMWEMTLYIQKYYAACFLAEEKSKISTIRHISQAYANKGAVEAEVAVKQAEKKLVEEDPDDNDLLDDTEKSLSDADTGFNKQGTRSSSTSFGSRLRER